MRGISGKSALKNPIKVQPEKVMFTSRTLIDFVEQILSPTSTEHFSPVEKIIAVIQIVITEIFFSAYL